jgi:hypothetical protein
MEETTFEWVEIARLNSPQYAEMLVQAMKDKGVPAVFKSDTGHFGMVGTFGTGSVPSGLGAYSLFVSDKSLLLADEIGRDLLGDVWNESKLVDIDPIE